MLTHQCWDATANLTNAGGRCMQTSASHHGQLSPKERCQVARSGCTSVSAGAVSAIFSKSRRFPVTIGIGGSWTRAHAAVHWSLTPPRFSLSSPSVAYSSANLVTTRSVAVSTT